MQTILVVERDATVAAVMRQILEDEGFAVRICLDAANCPEMIRDSPIDLIVMELLTPTPSVARQVIDELRRDPRSARIPILVCTVDDHHIRQWSGWLRQHCIPALSKPFDIDAFSESVNHALTSRCLA